MRTTILDVSDFWTTAVLVELAKLDVGWLLPDAVGVDRTASPVAAARLPLALALTLWM
jgi:hypothetical protein